MWVVKRRPYKHSQRYCRLNSREFLGEKLSQTTVIDERQFHFAPAQHTTESGTANVEYELGNMAITFNNESNKRSEKDCLPGSV